MLYRFQFGSLPFLVFKDAIKVFNGPGWAGGMAGEADPPEDWVCSPGAGRALDRKLWKAARGK